MYVLTMYLDLELDSFHRGSGEVLTEIRDITCLVTVQYLVSHIDDVITALLLLPICNPEARSEEMGSIRM
jgi:hypothetical protein